MIYNNIIKGINVSLKYVECADAEIILKLRTNQLLNKHIHDTENDLEKQKQWILNQQKRDGDYYFVILNKKAEKIGVVSIYNIKNGNGELGRWISIGNAKENLESIVLMHEFGFNTLKLKNLYTCTSKDNTKIINFWKRFGGEFGGLIEVDKFTLSKNIVSVDKYLNEISKKVKALLE